LESSPACIKKVCSLMLSIKLRKSRLSSPDLSPYIPLYKHE